MRQPVASTALLLPLLALAGTARAQDAPEIVADLPPSVVEATRPAAPRESIPARLGVREYEVDRATIEALPGGPATPLNQILLQTPGAVQDSFGEIHIRGEHRNIQYRLNGVMLPEGLTGFGQVFDGLAFRSVSVLAGALPAQYGFRANAIIDLTTRSGATDPGGAAGITVGTHNTLQPYASWAGLVQGWDVFAAGSFLHNDIGIENPAPTRRALNDTSQQTRGLLSAARDIAPDLRFAVIGGLSVSRFEIPTRAGLVPDYPAFGSTAYNSASLNAHQWERTYYGTAALQQSYGWGEWQVAAFSRLTSIHYVPDTVGELRFNGISTDVQRQSWTAGLQSDLTWRPAPDHAIRVGLVASREQWSFNNQSWTLPVDGAGDPIDDPFRINSSGSKAGWLYGVYVQDEWRATDRLTVNFGLRADVIDQFTTEAQLSPRINMVWRATDTTTINGGYARSFTPPQMEMIPTSVLARYIGTTAAPNSLANDPPRPESAHRFDIGIQQRIGENLTLGADAYYKHVTDLLDYGQFGNALIFSPFNYRYGRIYGVEFTASWRTDSLLLYANLSLSRATGREVRTGQYNFESDELAYIANHFIRTDHDQLITGSAGGVWRAWDGGRLSATMLYGNGLRAGFANTEKLASYATANIGVAQDMTLPDGGRWTVRLDVINLFDRVYEIRDGTGVGVGAPQWGLRRTLLAGLSRAF